MNDVKSIVKEIKRVKSDRSSHFSYSDYVCESLDKTIKYTEYLAEQINNNTQYYSGYNEYVSEKLNELLCK
jgi:hypothetical protein